MKKTSRRLVFQNPILALCALAGGLALVAPATTKANPPTPPAGTSWTQTFNSDFSGSSVDTNVWINQAVYWTGSTGQLGGTDCFTGQGYLPTAYYYQEAVSQSGGDLYLESVHAPGTDPGQPYEYAQNGYPGVTALDYYTGQMTVRHYDNGQTLQSYGYFECRMKAAVTQGVDTAFYMFSPVTPHGYEAEIDVAEFAGSPHFTNFNASGTHGNVSQGTPGGDGVLNDDRDYTGDFHTYGVDWQPDHLDFYIDGVLTKHDVTNVPSYPMYMIVSQQMQDDNKRTDGTTGNFFGEAANGTFPCTSQVQWVRSWSRPVVVSAFSGPYKIINANTGLALDDLNSSMDGSTVGQYAQTANDNNQVWNFADAGNGYYNIVSAASGKVLDAGSSNPGNGQSLLQYTTYNDAAQQWSVNAVGNGTYTITTTTGGNKAIDDNNSSSNGTSMILYAANGNPNQQFYLVKQQTTFSGSYKIINASTGQVLDNLGGSSGSAVGQYANIASDSNQVWNFENSGNDGYYNIVSAATGLLLDAGSSNPGNGQELLQYISYNDPAQQWFVNQVGNNLYLITTSTGGDKAIDDNNSDSNGTPMILYGAENNANQLFLILAQ